MKTKPRWFKLFVGRTLLRTCATKDDCACDRCHLRAVCKCAAEDLSAASAVESRVWIILGFCGATAIGYAFYAYLA